MKGIKIPHLIFTAALCWLVLIGIQVKWISDSKHLIEEQFDQKVSLALAAAVGSMAPEERLKCAPLQSNMICQPMNSALFSATQADTVEAYDDTALRAAVDQAFLFYDINMPYVLQVASSSSPESQTTSPYCCAITPFEHKSFAVGDDAAGTMLNITFPGKKAYVLKKIWWMLVASLFILLFVLVVFILAVRSVIHQQRISQWNIDFFNNMAHEFRTPLTNISLAVQRLVKRKPDLAEDKYLGVVHKEGVKLGAQIDRVLSIAELQHDGTYLQPEKIDHCHLKFSISAD
ncbi:MAG: histidine kinase dimerization/phospho-acceptor domain-containing protein, partial [Bacteroidota bacterium]